MGNDIKTIGGKVGKIISQFDTPQDHTDQGVPQDMNQNIEDCKELNNLLLKHILNLGSKLQLEEGSIVKNGPKWEKSIIRGILQIDLLQQVKPKIEEQEQEKPEEKKEQLKQQSEATDKQSLHASKSNNLEKVERVEQIQDKLSKKISHTEVNHKKKSYRIILSLAQMYELKRLLASYTQEEKQLDNKRKTFSGELCVICLDSKPEEVLPCAHEYCKKCVNMYIISKDKKCPMCRKSYQQSLSQNIYQIVEWDEDFVIEMRTIFYKILEKNNPKQVQRVRKIIQANQIYEKSLTPKESKEEQV